MKSPHEPRYADRLRRRRYEIDVTLRHLESERRQVEANTEWVNRAAYDKRVDLLERLAGWYRDEIAQVEAAIERARKAAQGQCAGCHKAIDAMRLAAAPGTELCADCEASHDAAK